MSDKLKNPVSNEEIIEELTKGIEASCIKVDENSEKERSVSENHTLDQKNDPPDSCEDAKEDDEPVNKDSVVPDDFIDEEQLKDRDITLGESEKQELKEEAERLKNDGNTYFKSAEFEKAITIYTTGLRTCPLIYVKERAILYSNRAAAKSKCQEMKESAIEDCSKAIELDSNYVKAYLRRAQLYEETEKLDEALSDYKTVLTFDPQHTEANYATRRLPPLIQERNEKLKTEMLGKLKDLGNMILKPFGLSTENFELQKNPENDSYSVKFNQRST